MNRFIEMNIRITVTSKPKQFNIFQTVMKCHRIASINQKLSNK